MATKVTILGQEQKDKPELKKIEFVKKLDADITISLALSKPDVFKNVELICKDYGGIYDLMFAYDDFRSDGILYLGHFNDGIV